MYGKRDYNIMAGKRVAAFVAIARKLGKEHPITKMMGARAWGRHGFEQGPTSTLRTAIREVAALDGAFDVINQWACDNDAAAQRVLRELYPRSMESAPEGVCVVTMSEREADSDQRATTALRCFACNRTIKRLAPRCADTRDGQWVYVGEECSKLVERAGEEGWQPPKGGPRLYPMPPAGGKA